MAEVAKRHQDRLEEIQKKIAESYNYFKENYDRYTEFRRFVFESSLTSEQIQLLQSMNRPQLEFNVLEAYISRLLGEFSKQEPDILVNAIDEDQFDSINVDFVQQHLKHVFSDEDNNHLKYEVYKDLLSGGFSAVKVYTEYEHSMSMNQVIKFERCEPTLVGFDRVTKLAHKGDSQFCFELFPKTVSSFKEEHPDIDLDKVGGSGSFGNFKWTYSSAGEKIILVVDFYEKKKRKETIIAVKGMGVMPLKEYENMIQKWDRIEAPPAPISKPRKTELDYIVRYRIIGNKVLEYEETDFDMLPIVFIDGNSLMISSPGGHNIRQVTRPYVYHAKGAQRLKNYAGISLANEIENTMQHKIMVAKEALPKEEELLDAYKNIQMQSVLVYNSYDEQNPEKPIPNPIREVNRVPAPPEITQAFVGSDQLVQNILGSYDAALGINNNQLSGVAITEAASQSNATAMPYIVGCLQGFQRLAQIYVSLMPKYYVTPRTMPIVNKDGRRSYVRINEEGSVFLNYGPNAFDVQLKAGASFQVQKSRTINMVKEVMQISPLFQQFISEKGLKFILDNMDGKGIEELKEMTSEYLQELEMQKQQAAQNPAPDPLMVQLDIEQQRTDIMREKNEQEFAIKAAQIQKDNTEVEIKQQANIINLMKALADINEKDSKISMQRTKQNIDLTQSLIQGLKL